jgi:aryl-alcohol dehydrogenase-like predicted oxidoreductase
MKGNDLAEPVRRARMNTRKLGSFTVAEIGLGCMNLSHAYGVPPAVEEAERVVHEALERGVTLFDTAALYGFGENERLLGRVLGGRGANVVLATKGGMAGVEFPEGYRRVIDGRPEAIRRNCEDSLRRLRTGVIDLYYLHRIDLRNRVPVEDSVGAMSRLVEEGKVRTLGLSEVSVATLRRANAVHPITAVQSEYSLWTRNPELGALDACRELGIAFVAFSPLGRGYLTGALRDVSTLDAKDLRRQMPRFSPDGYPKNLRLLDGLGVIAREVGCTLSQLALAWLLQRGEHVIPIPGTTSVQHVTENVSAAEVSLMTEPMARLDAIVNQRTVAGARYAAAVQAEIDTEDFS